MHALEWIALHGRFDRSLSADWLRSKLGRQKGECTWCAKTVPSGRRRWCSQACVADYQVRCNPGHAAWEVRKRDKGICSLCGIDVEKSAELVKSIERILREMGGCLWSPLNRERQKAAIESLGPYPRYGCPAYRSKSAAWSKRKSCLCCCIGCLARKNYPTSWQADHIVPVAEGGGLCSLDGLRTACDVCHKRLTRDLARRLANKKKAVIPLAEMPLFVGD